MFTNIFRCTKVLSEKVKEVVVWTFQNKKRLEAKDAKHAKHAKDAKDAKHAKDAKGGTNV